MSNPEQKVTRSLLELLGQGEEASLEFKETLEVDIETGGRSVKSPEIVLSTLKTVAAFLNTDGGTLLIGVSDKSEIKGLNRDYKLLGKKHGPQDEFEQKIRNLLHSHLDPKPLDKVGITFPISPDGVAVCRIDVTPVPKQEVVHVKGEVYVRDGNRTMILEGSILTDWLQRRIREAPLTSTEAPAAVAAEVPAAIGAQAPVLKTPRYWLPSFAVVIGLFSPSFC